MTVPCNCENGYVEFCPGLVEFSLYGPAHVIYIFGEKSNTAKSTNFKGCKTARGLISVSGGYIGRPEYLVIETFDIVVFDF